MKKIILSCFIMIAFVFGIHLSFSGFTNQVIAADDISITELEENKAEPGGLIRASMWNTIVDGVINMYNTFQMTVNEIVIDLTGRSELVIKNGDLNLSGNNLNNVGGVSGPGVSETSDKIINNNNGLTTSKAVRDYINNQGFIDTIDENIGIQDLEINGNNISLSGSTKEIIVPYADGAGDSDTLDGQHYNDIQNWATGTFVDVDGDTMNGNLDMNNNRFVNIDWANMQDGVDVGSGSDLDADTLRGKNWNYIKNWANGEFDGIMTDLGGSCASGQVPVMENGEWKCGDAGSDGAMIGGPCKATIFTGDGVVYDIKNNYQNGDTLEIVGIMDLGDSVNGHRGYKFYKANFLCAGGTTQDAYWIGNQTELRHRHLFDSSDGSPTVVKQQLDNLVEDDLGINYSDLDVDTDDNGVAWCNAGHVWDDGSSDNVPNDLLGNSGNCGTHCGSDSREFNFTYGSATGTGTISGVNNHEHGSYNNYSTTVYDLPENGKSMDVDNVRLYCDGGELKKEKGSNNIELIKNNYKLNKGSRDDFGISSYSKVDCKTTNYYFVAYDKACKKNPIDDGYFIVNNNDDIKGDGSPMGCEAFIYDEDFANSHCILYIEDPGIYVAPGNTDVRKQHANCENCNVGKGSEEGEAATHCTNLSAGGKDWQLPSNGELQAIYDNKSKLKSINLDSRYWASKYYGRYGVNYRWGAHDFENDYRNRRYRSSKKFVRCIAK